MPASSDFKGLPLQTSPKAPSEPKGLFPAVTNSPRLATGAPFQRPTKVNAGRCKHGCRGAAVRVAAGDSSVAVLRRATTAQPHTHQTLEPSADTTCETGGAVKGGGDEYDDNKGHHRADPMGRPHLGRVAKERRQYHRN